MKRIFIALPIPDEISAGLLPLQWGILGARFSPPENFHITLRFIGEISEDVIEDLDEKLGEINFPKFEIKLKGVDYFGHDLPHSVHATIEENENLRALHKKCDEICAKLKLPNDRKKYVPHVTLAYLDPTIGTKSIMEYCARNSLFKSKKWRADRFYLYASSLTNGPSHYDIIAQYPLV